MGQDNVYLVSYCHVETQCLHTCSMCESPPWHWALTTCGLVWHAALLGTLTTGPRCSLSSVQLWIGEMEQLSWGVLGRGRAHSKLRHHSKEQGVTSLGQIWLGALSHSISPAIPSSLQPCLCSSLLWGRGALDQAKNPKIKKSGQNLVHCCYLVY